MATCCPPSAWPALAPPEDYTPKGTELKLEDLPIYTVGEPGPKAVIVLPEVFGWSGRLKGICDTIAGEGYYVIMPDCHRGTTAGGDHGMDFATWASQYTWDSHIKGDFDKMMAFLTTQGATSVGAVGFCFGAWALCKASACGMPLVCGAGPHPSTRLEGMIGGEGASEAAMMAQVKMPVLLLPAGDDPDNVKPGGEVASLLEGKGGASVVFPEMKHGWVSRGDVSDPAVKRDAEAAITKILEHFKAHLA